MSNGWKSHPITAKAARMRDVEMSMSTTADVLGILCTILGCDMRRGTRLGKNKQKIGGISYQRAYATKRENDTMILKTSESKTNRMGGSTSVSYTHLTLPTNREV